MLANNENSGTSTGGVRGGKRREAVRRESAETFEYVSRATKDEEMEVDEWVPNASQGLPKTLGARWVYLRGSSVRTCALAVLRLGGGRC